MENRSNPIESKSPFETVVLNHETSQRVGELALQLPSGVYDRSFRERGDFIEACGNISKELI